MGMRLAHFMSMECKDCTVMRLGRTHAWAHGQKESMGLGKTVSELDLSSEAQPTPSSNSVKFIKLGWEGLGMVSLSLA